MPEAPSSAEAALRCDLAACYRLVAMMGWDDLLYTHLSVRIPGPEHHFLLNPFGLLFEEVTASSLVKVDLDGNIVEPSPHPINTAGFTIHSAVHAAREDAMCVMHLHTVAGTGVACQEEGLMPLHQEAMLIRGQLAYHDYEGVALDHDERPRLVADLGDKNFMLLRSHGTPTSRRQHRDSLPADVPPGAGLRDADRRPGRQSTGHRAQSGRAADHPRAGVERPAARRRQIPVACPVAEAGPPGFGPQALGSP